MIKHSDHWVGWRPYDEEDVVGKWDDEDHNCSQTEQMAVDFGQFIKS